MRDGFFWMICPDRPIRKTTMAELWSRSNSQPQGQECHRSSSVFFLIAPHPLQIWLVCLGSTSSTREPASSALFSHCCTNCAQPASLMDLFNPDLALAPFGRYAPVSASCFGLARLLIFAGASFSKKMI